MSVNIFACFVDHENIGTLFVIIFTILDFLFIFCSLYAFSELKRHCLFLNPIGLVFDYLSFLCLFHIHTHICTILSKEKHRQIIN